MLVISPHVNSTCIQKLLWLVFHHHFEIQQMYARCFSSPISIVLFGVDNKLSYDGKTFASVA